MALLDSRVWFWGTGESSAALAAAWSLSFIHSSSAIRSASASFSVMRARMELMAAIAGLEALNRPCEVELYSDSRYLVDAFNQKWIDGWVKHGWNRPKSGPVKNSDLWKRLLKAMEPHVVTFFWVKGHDGHPENERCDRLATAAADGSGLLTDTGLEV